MTTSWGSLSPVSQQIKKKQKKPMVIYQKVTINGSVVSSSDPNVPEFHQYI